MATGIFNCLKCLIFWFFYPKSFGSFSSQFRKAEACLKLLGKVIWKTNFRSHKIPHVLRSHTLGDHSLKKKVVCRKEQVWFCFAWKLPKTLTPKDKFFIQQTSAKEPSKANSKANSKTTSILKLHPGQFH